MTKGYWHVHLSAFAFDTEDEARAFMDALTDAFCDMPEAKEVAASARVEFVPADREQP